MTTAERRPSDPRADDLRRRYVAAFGAPDTIPVSVEAIATDLLGLWIEEVPELPVSGALIPSERTILLNRDEPDVRKRFTPAHELGHWVCQCDEGRDPRRAIYCRGADMEEPVAKELEREANRFAATLLMPDEYFVQGATALAEAAPVVEIAHQFGVSVAAIAWRLYNAGITDVPPE